MLEATESFCTIFVAFPGLYLTYNAKGDLVETETCIERAVSGKRLVVIGEQGSWILNSEMG